MKKLLLVSTAIAGVALMSSPASAALKMDLGGYFEGYGVYADNNDTAHRNFEFRRNNEIFVNGESTLDNGLTIGAHTQLNIADTANTSTLNNITGANPAPGVTINALLAQISATTTSTQLVDETYLYASGQWGRLNFGEEDGAAYLLQVAAPSGDSNVDGMRVYIQGLDTANWDANLAGAVLSYQQADFRQTDRLTYLTPKFNGFQAGVSYAPRPGTAVIGTSSALLGSAASAGTAAMAADNVNGLFQNPWEAAARWDGRFSGVDLSLGGGYSDAQAQNAGAAGTAGSRSLQTYNFGANVGISGFSLGGVYKHSNNGIAETATTNDKTKTWVVGGAYDNGPYHVGASYFHETIGDGLLSGAHIGDSKVHRYAVGGGYTFGPGMTFRGSVDWGKFNANAAAATSNSERFTQVTVGTDVQF